MDKFLRTGRFNSGLLSLMFFSQALQSFSEDHGIIGVISFIAFFATLNDAFRFHNELNPEVKKNE